MAKWLVYRRRDNDFTIMYCNLQTGRNEKLGDLRGDTKDEHIVDWVMQNSNTVPGDMVVLPSGRVAQLMAASGMA